ncbi:MAG TPA: GDSL-type esterase/lipase family protein [Cytophagaceae bacterium]|jgi:hypothetical protein
MKNYLLLSCCLAFVNIYGQAPIRIVCMGNSITNGKVSGGKITELSYRPWLWEKLDSAGYSVDFVGYTNLWFKEDPSKLLTPPTSRYTGKVFDRGHDSYYGIKSKGLLKGNKNKEWTGTPLPSLSVRLNKYTPDIALLHIGTNDLNKDVKNTVKNIEAIIDELRKKNPEVKIFVAKLITGWKPINARVDEIVKNKTTAKSPVFAVDIATGFINDTTNKSTTMTFDWVHPNERGQSFMADRWFKAIQDQIPLIPTNKNAALKPKSED